MVLLCIASDKGVHPRCQDTEEKLMVGLLVLIIIILLAVLWIVLKILGAAIKLPFKILGVLLSQPFSTIFWIVVILYIVYYVIGH